jgi:hypothetical protein
MANQLQSVLREDQCEFIGNTDQVRKIQRRARGGYIAHGTSILIAAILDFGGLHNTDTWRNPGFDHREKLRRTLIKGDSIQKGYYAAERLNIREFPACRIASARLVTQK